ncbi:hypothetical protein J5I95_08375 [Candidatus Poribacteria bacterium]|nr:hypothetical protein [Candidatus Poribacteria bacterium]
MRCIIIDKGYIDNKRQVAFAKDDLLLTPKTIAEANAFLGADPLYTATQVETWQARAKSCD